MEPCDAVKLVYQSVLGGGHLITDPARSLERLAEEYAAVPQTVGPLYEALGNGVVRVHLSRLDAWGVGLEALNSWFVRSAEACPGTRKALEASLWELIRAAEGHVGTFDETGGEREEGLHITARVNTARGVACRAVAEMLPPYVQPAEPTLEDAYLYLISGEGEA